MSQRPLILIGRDQSHAIFGISFLAGCRSFGTSANTAEGPRWRAAAGRWGGGYPIVDAAALRACQTRKRPTPAKIAAVVTFTGPQVARLRRTIKSGL
jgi:hypothetical protein